MSESGLCSSVHPIWLRVLWFHLSVITILLLLGVVTLAAGSFAKRRLSRNNPAPGRMIDIGGYRLHLICRGEGGPAVILDSGLNEFSLSWAKVQPEVAKFTRVCSYDRAGLGWSDPGPSPRTSRTMVRELHDLLRAADVRGPYVLVGHSFGGMNIRLFAREYPDEVAGLVLVDSAHEDEPEADRNGLFRKFYRKLLRILRVGSFLNQSGVFALAPSLIPDRGLPPEVLPSYRALLASTGYFDGALAESLGWDQSAAEVRDARISGLGSLPLVVMRRGLPQPLPGITGEEYRELDKGWSALQARMLGLSSESRLVVAERSDHFIQLRQPELVVDAIRSVWDRSRRVHSGLTRS